MAVVSVDKYLLCAYADASVDFGMLKKKVRCWLNPISKRFRCLTTMLRVLCMCVCVGLQLEVTRDYLEEPLSRIEDDDDTTGTL